MLRSAKEFQRGSQRGSTQILPPRGSTQILPPRVGISSSVRQVISKNLDECIEEVYNNNDDSYYLLKLDDDSSILLKNIFDRDIYFSVLGTRNNNNITYYCTIEKYFSIDPININMNVKEFTKLDSNKHNVLTEGRTVEHDESKYILLKFIQANKTNFNFSKKKNDIFVKLQEIVNSDIPENRGGINNNRNNFDNMVNQLLKNNTNERKYMEDSIGNLTSKLTDFEKQKMDLIAEAKNTTKTINELSNIKKILKEVLKNISNTTYKLYNFEKELIKFDKITSLKENISSRGIYNNLVKEKENLERKIRSNPTLTSTLTSTLNNITQQINNIQNIQKELQEISYDSQPINNNKNKFKYVSIFDCKQGDNDGLYKTKNNVLYINKKLNKKLNKKRVLKGKVTKITHNSSGTKTYTINRMRLITNKNILNPVNNKSRKNTKVKLKGKNNEYTIQKVYKNTNGNKYFELSNEKGNTKVYSENNLENEPPNIKIGKYINPNLERTNLVPGNKINDKKVLSKGARSFINRTTVYRFNNSTKQEVKNINLNNVSFKKITQKEPMRVKYNGKVYNITGVYKDPKRVRITSINKKSPESKNVNINQLSIAHKSNIPPERGYSEWAGKRFGQLVTGIPSRGIKMGLNTGSYVAKSGYKAGKGLSKGLATGMKPLK
jgi:hypothetical protein